MKRGRAEVEMAGTRNLLGGGFDYQQFARVSLQNFAKHIHILFSFQTKNHSHSCSGRTLLPSIDQHQSAFESLMEMLFFCSVATF